MRFPYDQDCPQCGAPAGRGCVDARWHPLPQAHQARGTWRLLPQAQQARSAWRPNGPRDQQYPNLEVNEAKWVRKQLGLSAHEPEEEILDLAEEFLRKKDYLRGRIGKTPDINQFKTSPELRAFLMQHATSLRIIYPVQAAAEATVVYDSTNWLVVMPGTLQSSIYYGKDTTWCTSRTDGANLFYNYVARPHDAVVLYYMVNKRDATSPTRRLSLGLVHGQPVFKGDGGVSVDADNVGVDDNRFRQILGPEFGPVFNAVTQHAASIQGQHPAKQALQALLEHPAKCRKYFKAMDKDAKVDFIGLIGARVYGDPTGNAVPDEILDILVAESGPSVREAAAGKHPPLLGYQRRLADDRLPSVRAALARSSLPLDLQQKLAADPDPSVRKVLAGSMTLPSTLRYALALDPDDSVRAELAGSYKLPLDLQRSFAVDPSPRVRCALAERQEHSGVFPEIEHTLVGDPDPAVRSALARGHALTFSLQQRLVQDPHPEVRRALAMRAPSSLRFGEIEFTLGRDPEPRVRRALIGATTNPDLLHILAIEGDPDLRNYIVRNAYVSTETLAHLAQDTDSHVRTSVAETATDPEVLRHLAMDKASSVRAGLLRNQHLPTSLRASLTQDTSGRVRAAAVYHTAADKDMWVMAEDRDPAVRAAIASREVPADLLLKLAQDSSPDVRAAVAYNQATPLQVLERLAQSSEGKVRRAVGVNHTTPVGILLKLAQDPDWRVRRALPSNTNLPREARERMAQHDSSQIVRREATFYSQLGK